MKKSLWLRLIGFVLGGLGLVVLRQVKLGGLEVGLVVGGAMYAWERLVVRPLSKSPTSLESSISSVPNSYRPVMINGTIGGVAPPAALTNVRPATEIEPAVPHSADAAFSAPMFETLKKTAINRAQRYGFDDLFGRIVAAPRYLQTPIAHAVAREMNAALSQPKEIFERSLHQQFLVAQASSEAAISAGAKSELDVRYAVPSLLQSWYGAALKDAGLLAYVEAALSSWVGAFGLELVDEQVGTQRGPSAGPDLKTNGANPALPNEVPNRSSAVADPGNRMPPSPSGKTGGKVGAAELTCPKCGSTDDLHAMHPETWCRRCGQVFRARPALQSGMREDIAPSSSRRPTSPHGLARPTAFVGAGSSHSASRYCLYCKSETTATLTARGEAICSKCKNDL